MGCYTPVVRLQMVREGSMEGRHIINNSRAAQALARSFFEYLQPDREVFVVASLDTKLRVVAVEVVSTGTLDASLVHPREVFKTAILRNASAIVAMHNHPSGDFTPSPQDLEVTRQLEKCGKMMGIRLLDHLIVGQGDEITVLSLADSNYGVLN